MHQITLKTIYLAMTYVAREEGIELDKKYYEMEDLIQNNNDLDVMDMVDNFENVYELLEDKPVTCAVCGESFDEADVNCVDYEIDLCIDCESDYQDNGTTENEPIKQSEKNYYAGVWITPSELGRELAAGDVVMMESFDYTAVVEISKVHEGELWHHDDWLIPRHQVVAVKQFISNK